jgi:6,7-dimethyl-8-ribityllumazine synthase
MKQTSVHLATSASWQPHVAVVSACWHRDIVERAHEGINAEFARQGLDSTASLSHFDAAGAFEIPLRAKNLAATGLFDAIIACGLIVNGGIYRHEFVNSAVIDGLMRVQLDTGVPVFSAVLTPRDFHDHDEHRNFFAMHFVKKGEEVAGACLATLRSMR